MPDSVSPYAPVAPSRGVVALIGDAVRWLVEMPRRRALIDELSTLSDHALADIGLNRGELDRVFDRNFMDARVGYRRVFEKSARI
ncbi:MAG TPA: DUF1127 domain-containing protein [Acetobacteraceae bacterium]|nr:DUF1127 domain-containing protein [Acetobacteraceae bacterium]